eukprot:1830923-Rhodomonas_salina.4
MFLCLSNVHFMFITTLPRRHSAAATRGVAGCLLHVVLAHLGEVVSGEAELLHHDVARRREAEAVDADYLAVEPDVLVPHAGHPGLHGHALGARPGEDLLLVGVRLPVEDVHRGHRDHAHAVTHGVRGLHRVLHLRARGHDDELEVRGLLLRDVRALEHAVAARGHRDRLERVHVLAREDERRRAVHALRGVHVGADGLLLVRGAHDVHVREHAERRHGLNRLMRRAVLADADGVVGQDVGHLAHAQRTGQHVEA